MMIGIRERKTETVRGIREEIEFELRLKELRVKHWELFRVVPAADDLRNSMEVA